MGSAFESLLGTPEASDAVGDRRVVEAMLRVEAALARAQAGAGLIPQEAAQSIIGTCKVELFDLPKLVRESIQSRCLVTPLVSSLRETVALFNPQAANFVHYGCSRQDLVDTALVLVTREVLEPIARDLERTVQALLALSARHAGDAMPSRDALQAGATTSFGLTCSQWAAPLVRSQQRLRAATERALCLRLGDEVATLVDLRGQAPQVTTLMAAELQLHVPAIAGDTAHDETVALACALGLLVAGLGKIAADVTTMASFEIDELTQPGTPAAVAPGARAAAPVPASMLCMVVQAAAQRVPQQVALLLATLSQEHGSAPGVWQTQLSQWAALLTASQSAARAAAQLVAGLQANTERMRGNLEAMRSRLNPTAAQAGFSAALAQQAADATRVRIDALLALRASPPQG